MKLNVARKLSIIATCKQQFITRTAAVHILYRHLQYRSKNENFSLTQFSLTTQQLSKRVYLTRPNKRLLRKQYVQ